MNNCHSDVSPVHNSDSNSGSENVLTNLFSFKMIMLVHGEETEYWYRYEPFFTIRLIGNYCIIKLCSF